MSRQKQLKTIVMAKRLHETTNLCVEIIKSKVLEVLGPTLFALYTNDLPSAVTSGSVFMYADDTTVYCIGDTVDNTVTSLNKALSELSSWCLENSLTPHSAKCEAMLLMRKLHFGRLNSVSIGEDRIEWMKHTRLLDFTIDDGFPGHITLQM